MVQRCFIQWTWLYYFDIDLWQETIAFLIKFLVIYQSPVNYVLGIFPASQLFQSQFNRHQRVLIERELPIERDWLIEWELMIERELTTKQKLLIEWEWHIERVLPIERDLLIGRELVIERELAIERELLMKVTDWMGVTDWTRVTD